MDPHDLVGDHRRPHARRPLSRYRRSALPLPMGRAGRTSLCRSICHRAAVRASMRSRRPSASGTGSSTPRSTLASTTPSGRSDRRPVVRFVRGRHYVPAWGVVIDAPDGSRLAYTGDTGPSAPSRRASAAPTCCSSRAPSVAAHDDRERGHLTAEEAIELAQPRRRPIGAPRPLRPGPRSARSRQAVRGRRLRGSGPRSTA